MRHRKLTRPFVITALEPNSSPSCPNRKFETCTIMNIVNLTEVVNLILVNQHMKNHLPELSELPAYELLIRDQGASIIEKLSQISMIGKYKAPEVSIVC